MADTRAELLGCLDGVLLGEGEVAGIETEVNIARIGVVHQALGFLEGLAQPLPYGDGSTA